METSPILWIIFLTIIASLLLFDLGAFSKERKMSFQKSLSLSIGYVLLGLSFGGFIWYNLGSESAYEYYTGYLIEKTLSLDNIFIFSLIFSYLKIPDHNHHRVLFYGILGVLLLRGVMILIGSAILSEFEWVLYIFGIILMITGIKLLFTSTKKSDIENNYILRFLRKYLNITNDVNDSNFLYWKKAKLYITPAFVALIMIETMDVIFAIDSIPAIFAITDNIYVIYTSNIFAILGLRAFYFCLDDIMERFYYLKYSLALILILIGIKIFVSQLIGKIPPYISFGLTLAIIGYGIGYSIYKRSGKAKNY